VRVIWRNKSIDCWGGFGIKGEGFCLKNRYEGFDSTTNQNQSSNFDTTLIKYDFSTPKILNTQEKPQNSGFSSLDSISNNQGDCEIKP